MQDRLREAGIDRVFKEDLEVDDEEEEMEDVDGVEDALAE